MIRWVALFLIVSFGKVAWANRIPCLSQGQTTPYTVQTNDEPAPKVDNTEPKGIESSPGNDEPGSQEEPGARSTDEPGSRSPDEPDSNSAGEPSKTGEPPPPKVVAKKKAEVSYGVGFIFRGIFIPSGFLNLFLDQSTSLNSVAIGGEFIRRKGNFDIVGSINLGFYSPADGNYLGKGDNPSIDTDYIQFRSLNVLTFDVTFLWHHQFTPWLSLVYGAGLGLGIVLGDIYRISNYLNSCTHDNIDNLGVCNPVVKNSPDPSQWDSQTVEDVQKWNENRDKFLQDGCQGSGDDSPQAPCLYREDGVWPVVPVVILVLGVNFKINEQFSVRVDGGFHNAFYVGATGQYFF